MVDQQSEGLTFARIKKEQLSAALGHTRGRFVASPLYPATHATAIQFESDNSCEICGAPFNGRDETSSTFHFPHLSHTAKLETAEILAL
jgi:hypothetical protein